MTMDREEILAVHDRLKAERTLRQVTVATWWCHRKKCQLAYVFRYGGEFYIYARPYHLRPSDHEQTSPAAREKNTFDGKTWKPRVWDVPTMYAWDTTETAKRVGLGVRCDHMEQRILSGQTVAAAVTEGANRPLNIVVPEQSSGVL